MRRAKQLIIVLCIMMLLMFSTGFGEGRQVYHLAEDCPVFSLPGDTEISQTFPKGKDVEVVLEMAFGGEDWSLVLSTDGTYGYVRNESLLTDATGLKVDISSQKLEKSQFQTVGNIVTFGRYEQDNNTANGPEEIEWIVLDVQEGKSLLLSRYGLDAQRYDVGTVWFDTWETSTLREWLNDEFINNAFTVQEQTCILMTKVDNNSSRQGYREWWRTSGGANTQDKVFLLSYAEANKYLGVTYDNVNNIESRVAPTAYAIQQGAHTSRNKETADGALAGWWWLRSPGCNVNFAAFVSYEGSLYNTSTYGIGCIRPALWVDLESDIF